MIVRAHRLAALAQDLRRAGFFRLGRALENLPSCGDVTQLAVPWTMWSALERTQPELAWAVGQDLAGRGIAIVTVPRGPVETLAPQLAPSPA